MEAMDSWQIVTQIEKDQENRIDLSSFEAFLRATAFPVSRQCLPIKIHDLVTPYSIFPIHNQIPEALARHENLVPFEYEALSREPMTELQKQNFCLVQTVERTRVGSFLPPCETNPVLNEFNLARQRAGGFICDATGLGKTRTMLELVRHDWLKGSRKPTLIVVQPNIVAQWRNECAKWVPDLPVFFLYGQYMQHLEKLKTQKYAIVLSTTQTISKYAAPTPKFFECNRPVFMGEERPVVSSLLEEWHIDDGSSKCFLFYPSDEMPDRSLQEINGPFQDQWEFLVGRMDHLKPFTESQESYEYENNWLRFHPDFVLKTDCAKQWVNNTHMRVWRTLEKSQEASICLCNANPYEKTLLLAMIQGAHSMYRRDNFCRRDSECAQTLSNRRWLSSAASCDCLSDTFTYNDNKCPCTYNVTKHLLTSRSIDAILYNSQALRNWLSESRKVFSNKNTSGIYGDMINMLSKSAHMWFYLFIALEMVYAKHFYFRMVYPRFGLWVMTKHVPEEPGLFDDLASSPCLLGRPRARATKLLSTDMICSGKVQAQTFCNQCGNLSFHTTRSILDRFRLETAQEIARPDSAQQLISTTHWRRLIIDEFHRVEASQSQFKNLFFDSAWLLTATPNKHLSKWSRTAAFFFGLNTAFEANLEQIHLSRISARSMLEELFLQRTTKSTLKASEAQMHFFNHSLTVPASWREWYERGNTIMQRLNQHFRDGREIKRINGLWANALLQGVPFNIEEYLSMHSMRSHQADLMYQHIMYMTGRAFPSRRQRASERDDEKDVAFGDLKQANDQEVAYRDESCTICMDDIDQATLVPCRHVFCFKCIVDWSQINSRCPVCRTSLEYRNAATMWKKAPIGNATSGQEASGSAPIGDAPPSSHVGLVDSMANESNPKLAWLERFVRAHLEEPVLVFVNGGTRAVANYLNERGLQAHALQESMSGTRIGSIVKQFVENKIKVLCLKYSLHSTGLDFFNAKHVVLLTPSVQAHETQQALGRVQRLSQKHDSFSVHTVLYQGESSFSQQAVEEATARQEDTISVHSISSTSEGEPALPLDWAVRFEWSSSFDMSEEDQLRQAMILSLQE